VVSRSSIVPPEKQIPEKDTTVKVYSYACKISYPMDAALVEHQMTLSHRHRNGLTEALLEGRKRYRQIIKEHLALEVKGLEEKDEELTGAIEANRNASQPVETIVLSSTHRLAENVSEKLHEAYKKTRPEVPMAQVAALKPKELQPAELLSTANYKPGEMIEYQPDGQKPARMAEVLQVIAQGVQVKGQLRGAQELVSFDKVTTVYKRTTLERGPGEVLLLTQKIKADGKVYENGSRQTIAAINGEEMRFESGLELRLDDGRVRQGDAVTTYKAQGASKTEMIRVEDNRSLLAMANREDLHVAFARHRANARMFVQDISVLRQVANRSLIKDITARDLEARKIAKIIERVEEALMQASRLAKRFATAAQRRAERIREIRTKKRREMVRTARREQNRAAGIAT
jgi:hypothetical protein